jgi:hypothetical protein
VLEPKTFPPLVMKFPGSDWMQNDQRAPVRRGLLSIADRGRDFWPKIPQPDAGTAENVRTFLIAMPLLAAI